MTKTVARIYADVVDLDRYPINDLDSDRGAICHWPAWRWGRPSRLA